MYRTLARAMEAVEVAGLLAEQQPVPVFGWKAVAFASLYVPFCSPIASHLPRSHFSSVLRYTWLAAGSIFRDSLERLH